ncbi:MAG: amidophosphoribosyltransferase [Vampirovibrionales bacterium]|nr:amidophosphoribosyltransferase [Vampirovibrionales bacterium]
MNTWQDLDKARHDKCGVFGVLAPPSQIKSADSIPLGELLYYGLYALQHRGQESCGMAVFDHDHLRLHKDLGLVSQVFQQPATLKRLSGQVGIGHTRYSTAGDGQFGNAQPVIARTPLGALALAHNGNLINPEALLEHFGPFDEQDAASLSDQSDSVWLTQALGVAIERCLSEVNNPTPFAERRFEAVRQVLAQCEGAFSLVIALGDCLIAARDRFGIRPLSLGHIEEGPAAGTWVVASETCALDIVGARVLRDIQPGELWVATRGGKTYSFNIQDPSLVALPPKAFCVFEMIYFSRPDSMLCEQSVYTYRLALGRLLAEADKLNASHGNAVAHGAAAHPASILPLSAKFDMVIPVPDSGNVAAVGYSQASGVPYVEGLIKNRYVGRTFINPSEGIRQQGLRLKLNPLTDVLAGKRVVVIDDSIVRGNTSRRLVKLLKEAGVAEIHLRVSSPPVKHPCFYGIDMSEPEQLIANQMSIADIQAWLDVDSLAYLSAEDLKRAFSKPDQATCSACFTHEYPAGLPQGARTRCDEPILRVSTGS